MRQISEVFDTTAVLESVGGDEEFLGELVAIFRAAWPNLLREIREALADEDLSAVEKTAHVLKITTQYLCARRAYLAAFLLEERKPRPTPSTPSAAIGRDSAATAHGRNPPPQPMKMS